MMTHPVFTAQDKAWQRLSQLPLLEAAKLCGGTALARFHLDHRISFDLDFFLAEGFDPIEFGRQAKVAGLKLKASDMVVDALRANQWHGFLEVEGQALKVSLVEDAYFDLYPVQRFELGGVPVQSEGWEGLYHRKLLTVTHASADGKTPTGGRQTARDLFDLWVLNQLRCPLDAFMERLPYDYPRPAFEEGLYSMPWFELTAQFSELRVAPGREAGRDVGRVRGDLFRQLDMDDGLDCGDDGPEPSRPRP